MRLAGSSNWIVALLLTVSPTMFAQEAARAQAPDSSQDTVAAAAKRATERKKDATSAKKVITDDDLNPSQMKPGDEGLKVSTPQLDTAPPSQAAVAADEAVDKKNSASPPDDPLKSTDSAKVAALKAELAKAEEDLKLSQRESALQQDTFYSNPDFQHDTAGKEKLAEIQQNISNNQQQVDDLKARLAAAQEAQSKQPLSGKDTESQTPPPTPPQS